MDNPDYIVKAKEELVDLFLPKDGSVNLYYGRIGQGKTYNATADILDLLTKGRVVYCNWHINYDGFDERSSFMHVFFKTLFFKDTFYYFPPENLRYFDPDDVDIGFLSSITDADVFVDEGQWIFDSYEGNKFSKEKRRLILHTRHLNRSLNIISQRTQAIQVSARGQVNRFYKCEKKMSWPFLIFKRTEYQEMKDNDVDENSEPASTKIYFANKKVMQAYDTKYLRGNIPASQTVHFEAYQYRFIGKLKLFFSHLTGTSARRLEPARTVEVLAKPEKTVVSVVSRRINIKHLRDDEAIPTFGIKGLDN